MRITVDVDLSNFNLDTGAIENVVSQELERTAHRIERQAKELAPVDTGDLRRSITTDGGGLSYEVGICLCLQEKILRLRNVRTVSG